VLKNDGELLVKLETRIGDDISKNDFINKNGKYDYISETVSLSSEEIDEIFKLANKAFENYIDENAIIEGILNDSWDVQILYDGKIIKQHYKQFEFPGMLIKDDYIPLAKDLVDQFIFLSPIEVNLHGWS